MPPIESKTTEEWDAEIKQHSLHLKHDTQLFALEESIEAKIPRIAQDLFEHVVFPGAIKGAIYFNLAMAGEIAPEPLTATELNPANQFTVDSEYLSMVAFYRDKKAFLEDKLACCQKEMELRADGLVERKPKGTTYYVDFDNGHDVDNDGSTTVKSNGDGPWATLDKLGGTLAAGDVGIVRRGMIQAVSADLVFADDGTISSPITVQADFADSWGDDTVAGQLATLTFGSKTVTFAGDISGDIAAGMWIYETNEDNKKFAYEVADVSGGSNEIVTLYLPYKGAQAGAGKTIEIMPANPIWNIAAGNFQVNLDSDHYWKFQGLHFRGTDSNGVMEIDSTRYVELHDMIFEANGNADNGITANSGASDVLAGVCSKCRFYNYRTGLYSSNLPGMNGKPTMRDCYFDGNSVSGSSGIKLVHGINTIIDSEFENHTNGDLASSFGFAGMQCHYLLRNCILRSANEIDYFDDADNEFSVVGWEDVDQVEGKNEVMYSLMQSTTAAALESETTKVRAGGGTTSIKVTPCSNLNTALECARYLLFEYPIYAVKDVALTYTVYFSSDDDTDWDADPLATELWIEAEYWNHATNPARFIKKSTGVCNNFDADDTVWDTLTVTVTPLQTGVLYLRGYYCKTKEAGKSNIFYCDTKIGIA